MSSDYIENVVAAIDQLEPQVAKVLHQRKAMGAMPVEVEACSIGISIAISLKRIADRLDWIAENNLNVEVKQS